MAGVSKSKWSLDAKDAFAKRGKKKGIKPDVITNVGPITASNDSPPIVMASEHIVTPPSGLPVRPVDVVETSTGQDIPGIDISQTEKDKKSKTSKSALDVAAALEMAPGLVRLLADGVGYSIQGVTSMEGIPFQATYTPVSNEMADAFCKANKATLERYLPGWYKDSPIFMLAISFGAMQVASLEFNKKQPKPKPVTPQEQMQNRIVVQPAVIPAQNPPSTNPNAPVVLTTPTETAPIGLG
jgi:hypothetical protein